MLPPWLDRVSRAASALPPALDPSLARVSGAVWSALDARRRSAVRANRAALGADFAVDRPFAASIEALLTWLRLVRAGSEYVHARTTFHGLEGPDGVREACDRTGAILIAAHVGFWEWGAASIASAGVPVVAVAGTQMNDAWSPALASAKRRLGVEIVGPETPAARLVEAMRGGALIALLVDGDVVTSRAPHVLQGRAIELPRGPGLLAARARAPIFAGRCERDRMPTAGAGRFVVKLERVFDPSVSPACHGTRASEVANARVARWLEATLAEDPGRWCLFREFFPSATVRA